MIELRTFPSYFVKFFGTIFYLDALIKFINWHYTCYHYSQSPHLLFSFISALNWIFYIIIVFKYIIILHDSYNIKKLPFFEHNLLYFQGVKFESFRCFYFIFGHLKEKSAVWTFLIYKS